MESLAKHRDFLGLWVLIPESCKYEQGDPPTGGRYRIEEQDDGILRFTAEWIDADGKEQQVVFSGPPDGSRQAFAGGDLADALSIEAVSDRELNSRAYYKGKVRMVAQRQLDDTRSAMRVTQMVYLPDGSRPANVSIYRRA
jgi:hypothetical protein